jgi:hypothetical protein
MVRFEITSLNYSFEIILFLIAVKESTGQHQEMDRELWTTDKSSSTDEPGISSISYIFNIA